MPVYKYVAKDYEGISHHGELETVDVNGAANLLRKKKLIIISIKPKADLDNSFFSKFFNRVAFNDVTLLTRQLSTMVGAGLVLSEALDVLVEQQTNPYLKKALDEISREVKGGIDFATALDHYPDIFPPIYSRLVKAGQASGKLDVILLDLAENLEKQREFKSKVKSAMIYPIVVCTMMVGVMMIMLFFVVPKLTALYGESGMELPLPTKIMIGTSNFVVNFWWAVLLAVVGVVLAFKRFVDKPEGKRIVEELVFRIPVAGRITKMVILTDFTRTFALLISSGLPILEAIRIVGDVVGNSVYKKSLEIVYQAVERGLSFSDQILALPVFPKIVGQMAKTGEETGKLDEILLKLSEYFESETDHSLKNLTTLIEPIVLVVLGIGVALLVISIILPIYQLTTNIK